MWFVPEIRFVRELRILIPVTREYTFGASAIEREAKATNSTEEIDELQLLNNICVGHCV
jgi:hypothetical protein